MKSMKRHFMLFGTFMWWFFCFCVFNGLEKDKSSTKLNMQFILIAFMLSKFRGIIFVLFYF